jgi:hypothetical protein
VVEQLGIGVAKTAEAVITNSARTILFRIFIVPHCRKFEGHAL